MTERRRKIEKKTEGKRRTVTAAAATIPCREIPLFFPSTITTNHR
jgi:hypothetical protein